MNLVNPDNFMARNSQRLMDSQKVIKSVTPAKAGVQK